MVFFFAEVKFLRFWAKTMDYNPWFFFWSPKKVLRKVYHIIGNGKRNLMTLVLVAWHLRVGSYECLKFIIHCTFEWGTNPETINVLYTKTKGASMLQN